MVGNVFWTASRRGCTTSPKPLRSRITNSQAVKKNRQARLIVFVAWDLKVGIHITLYKPPSHVTSHSFHSSKMTKTQQEQLMDQMRLFFVFDLYKTPKAAEPSTCPASITITPTHQTKKEATESMNSALDTTEVRERLLQNTLR